MKIGDNHAHTYYRKHPSSQVNLNYFAALNLAKAGWWVFPAKPDKSPYIKGWQTNATKDPAVIVFPNSFASCLTTSIAGS